MHVSSFLNILFRFILAENFSPTLVSDTILCVSLPQMAYPKSHNPFADDEEEEEFESRNRGFNFNDDPNERGMSEAERKQRYLQQEVMRTAKSAVDSSYRSLGLIYESEKMGVETAEV